MPRGIYVRKNGKVGITVTEGKNPIQQIADEVVELRKKAMTAKPSKRMILARNKARLREADKVDSYPKQGENKSDLEYLRMENEQMKEHLSYTHRVLTDRVETIIMLLENLKRSL